MIKVFLHIIIAYFDFAKILNNFQFLTDYFLFMIKKVVLALKLMNKKIISSPLRNPYPDILYFCKWIVYDTKNGFYLL